MHIDASAAGAPEQPLPRCSTVDVSRSGLLVAFGEPVGFPVGHRLVISLALDDGRCHLMGSVNRIARGDDFRTYVALDVSSTPAAEIERVSAHLRHR